MKTYLSALFLFVFISVNLNGQCLKSNEPGVHTVQKGETLYRIASTHDVSIQHLLIWNKMEAGDPLTICQDIYVAAYAVPASGPAAANNVQPGNFDERSTQPIGSAATTAPTVGQYYKKQTGKRHVVQAGETIAGLADLYGYTEKRFRELNALSGVNSLSPGSTLLSSDCNCDRISYDDGSGLGFSDTGTTSGTSPVNTGTVSGTSTQPARDNPSTGTTSASTNNKTAMSSLELTMVDEINLMRSNPASYVRYIQEYVNDQKTNGGFPINDAVVSELISELRASPVLSNLQPMGCIYEAARKHGQDCRKIGSLEHQGSDGRWPWDRVLDACPNLKDGNENLVGGPESVRESVIILLIDDGIASRGHRKTLMRSDWKYVACHKVGEVGGMPNCWIQKFGY